MNAVFIFYFQSIFLLELLAGSNHLSEIPISINLHKRLREVRFPHNQISTLRGVNFVQIKSLEILDLRNNKITVMDVPFPFSLSSLILSNNSIVDVPTGLTSLPNLQTLQLTGEINQA